MNIIVCLKQVPRTNDVRLDPETGSLIREGVPSIINPEDSNALEEALLLKEEHGGNVVAISMGPPQAEEALRDALAMGADEAILLCDKAFAGADTLATSFTLGTAIKKLGDFYLILCGTKTLDGNTGQVGPQLAEFLDLPQITYARRVEVQGEILRAERAFEEGYELMETRLPALVTVTKEINEPRIPADIEDKDMRVSTLNVMKETTRGIGLEQAEMIVAGGMGVRSAEDFRMLGKLAELLGAEVGATRDAVEAGWASSDRMIGQTGKTVRPRLYIACGISGATQHIVGMQDSELIVAISKDPKAPIFQIADYGIVADLHQVIPLLTQELLRRKSGT